MIVDDVTYLSEPFFQDGPVANAVSAATAAGVSYFSAAGNNHRGSSYEAAAYRPLALASCPAAVASVGAADCHDFDPTGATDGAFELTIPPGGQVSVDLQWNQPRKGVTTDLDLYLLGPGGAIASQSEGANVDQANQLPVEIVGATNPSTTDATTAQIVVTRATGPGGGDSATPRLKFVVFGSSTPQATNAPDLTGHEIFGHSGTADAQSVAAINAGALGAPEPFSSRGPVTLYWQPVTGGGAPAGPLTPPTVLAKPDITASDCTATTFFFGAGHVFCGTSAAVPHAAGVAALQLQHNPTATPAQVRAAQIASAVPIGSSGPDDVGQGLLQADAAVTATSGPSGPSGPTGPSGPSGGGADNTTPTPTPTATPVTTEPISPQPASPGTPTIILGPSGPTRDSTPTFSFQLPDALGTAQCAIDDQPYAACSGPGASHTASPKLGDGAHTFHVRALIGGLASSPADRSFVVDTKRPAILVTKRPARRTASRRARFVFRAEKGATVRCALDAGAPRRCRSPKRYRALIIGRHVFRVTAKDTAGNARSVRASWTIRKSRQHHRR